jgi:hypothetical protein
METQIGLDFLPRCFFFPQLAIYPGQRHVRLGVGGIKPRCLFEFLHGSFRLLQILQNRSQLKVSLLKSRFQTDCFAQVVFGFRKPIQKLLRDGQVQIRPRRRMRGSAIEVDGLL